MYTSFWHSFCIYNHTIFSYSALFPILFFVLGKIVIISCQGIGIVWRINIYTLYSSTITGRKYFENFEVFTFNDDVVSRASINATLCIVM